MLNVNLWRENVPLANLTVDEQLFPCPGRTREVDHGKRMVLTRQFPAQQKTAQHSYAVKKSENASVRLCFGRSGINVIRHIKTHLPSLFMCTTLILDFK